MSNYFWYSLLWVAYGIPFAAFAYAGLSDRQKAKPGPVVASLALLITAVIALPLTTWVAVRGVGRFITKQWSKWTLNG